MPQRPLALTSLVVILFLTAPALAQKAPDPAPEPTKPGATMPVAPSPAAPAPAPTATDTTSPAAPSAPAAQSEGEIAFDATLASLTTEWEPGEAAEFTALLLDNAAQGLTGDSIGHLLFMRRHFAHAAWFFGTDAAGDPSDPASLNNFAAMLVEVYAADPDNADPMWLQTARRAAEAAAALAPDSAAIQNTLGNVARAAGDTATAVSAGERATTLAPEEALYWTNLARAHAAAGTPDAAAAALARAHALDPNGTAVRVTTSALPAIAAPYGQYLQSQCNVDFNCAQICPGGIVGGLMRVTCEMESASAQLSCQQGQPYATSYNCQEEFPEYGILIPGLNSGFSVSLPGFSMHVLVDGNGDVRVRVEGGLSRGRLGAYVGADGTYSPTNGASFDAFRGGVRVNILPPSMGGGSAADEAAGRWGQPPAQIELEGNSSGEATLGAEAYNAGLIST
ncbi:hypothetical protein [Nioella nitratireducens]|uniref:hypothetical protein n=1 Tax=Nioella nitratireducens TaxID=1287720 RepID=UPI0008FD63B3|nr:hypothetical protein [Nioella nitratireducens]